MESQRELAPENWAEYLDAASRELFNAQVSIEIVEQRGEPQIEGHHLALQLLTYDRRGDVFEVAAAKGGPHLPNVLRHMVDRPERILVDSRSVLPPMTISVDGHDGVRTVIRIEREPEFTG